jgi:hypothetical protein
MLSIKRKAREEIIIRNKKKLNRKDYRKERREIIRK